MKVNESMVTQLAGHVHKNLTFGLYGEKFPVALLANKMNGLTFFDETSIYSERKNILNPS
jgi:hypothetical protein